MFCQQSGQKNLCVGESRNREDFAVKKEEKPEREMLPKSKRAITAVKKQSHFLLDTFQAKQAALKAAHGN